MVNAVGAVEREARGTEGAGAVEREARGTVGAGAVEREVVDVNEEVIGGTSFG